MRLFRAFATVSGFVILSRILGFARDMLIARALGTSYIADAFFVAFRFPSLFRNLFAEGALNASFVPVFSAVLETQSREHARLFAEQVLSLLLITLVLFFFAVEAAMPWFLDIVAPGFGDHPEQYDLAVRLTRLTFPFLLFVALSALLTGLLNSLYRFAAGAGAPVMLNVVLLCILFVAWPSREAVGTALATGVAIGGFVQFMVLIVACHRAGMDLRLLRPRLTPDVRRMLRLIGPAALGAGTAQINLVIGTALGSLVGTGAISYLYYAERVNWLPVGVLGAAMGTAVLPRISRLLKAGDAASAMATQNRALEILALFGLPAAGALIVMADPIVTVLYQRAAFTADDTVKTAAALTAYACGLPAYLAIRVLAPAFFARQDTATPVKVGIGALFVNGIASLILMQWLDHVGIALGNILAAWTNVLALWLILHRRGQFAPDARLLRHVPRLALAALAMIVALLAVTPVLRPLIDAGMPLSALGLMLMVGLGAAVYGAAAMALGAARLADLRAVLARRPPEGGA